VTVGRGGLSQTAGAPVGTECSLSIALAGVSPARFTKQQAHSVDEEVAKSQGKIRLHGTNRVEGTDVNATE